jgi:hypothetical protein
MAGNSLIGLPTKEFIKRYEGDKEYMKYAMNFLKKGLTYSHFWCNEVKNALRLVTWPHGKLPEPNDNNIHWLLRVMWYGVKISEESPKRNRWFDKNACFVIYKKGGASYKFYNLVHYFTLRADDWQGMPSAELMDRKGKAWIERRFIAIKAYVQDICNDIRRFTMMKNSGANTMENLSNTLKQIYKDKVINGSKSTYEWPPRIMAVKAKSQVQRKINFNNRTKKAKSANGPRSNTKILARGGKSPHSTKKKRR